MAKKTSELDAADAIADTHLFPISQDPGTPGTFVSRKASGAQLRAYLAAAPGAAAWGAITGTLASQLDLIAALDAKASIAYVDALLQGLSWKKAVRAASTANGTLASAFENGDTIDGVTLATGDRILLKNQSTAAENGIYVVNASGAPTRAADADAGAEVVNATVYISEGTTLADTQWTCSTNSPITLGSTSVAFVQLSAGGGATWGAITGTLTSQADLQTALDAKAAVGVPQNSQSSAYTLVLSDANKHIFHPSADTPARIFTIPANSSVPFPIGTTATFVNQNAAGVVTIAITTDTMRLAGAGTTGNRTLAANGIATAIKITATEWIINGTGLT